MADTSTPGRRADVALAEAGLARSRSHAATLIADGRVTADGAPVTKASFRVPPGASLAVEGADHYVSRAAHKLLAALDGFGVDPTDVVALDIGASTGGFTQVLLERGARHVVALDVGHGQLSPQLAGEPRITLIEGMNVRDLSLDTLRTAGVTDVPGLIVADLSFISLRFALPAMRRTAPDAEAIVLVKPQFEVGRAGVREGVVRDPALRAEAVEAVLWAAHDEGYRVGGLMASPITGGQGNHEYLALLGAHAGAHPTEWVGRIPAIVEG